MSPLPPIPYASGRRVAISSARQFMVDLLHYSRKIPALPMQRTMDLSPLIEARAECSQRISWNAIFVRAYALVAARHPELRRTYMPYPWAHYYEHPVNVATVSVEREHAGEKCVFFAKLFRPERTSLIEIDRRWREPKRIAFVTARPGFFPSSAAMYLLPQFTGKLMDLRVFSIMSPTIDKDLSVFRPHALFGYASSLDHLARSSVELGQQLEHINNSSEQLTEAIRQRLRSVFKVPILDHYGCGECLQLADLCPAGRFHINADLAILEPVDDQLQPVPAGVVSSKVLVTNLVNHVQPFIRYIVDDRVCLSTETKCACGSSLPQLEALHGRSSDQLVVRSTAGQRVALPAIVFQNVTDHNDRIIEWRVVQESSQDLVFEWQTTARSDDEQNKLFAEFEEQLRSQGLPEFVRLRQRSLTGAVLDPVSGKRKRLVARTAITTEASDTPADTTTTV